MTLYKIHHSQTRNALDRMIELVFGGIVRSISRCLVLAYNSSKCPLVMGFDLKLFYLLIRD